MDSDLYANGGGDDSWLNWDNYVPTEQFCNTIVYTHKKFLKPKKHRLFFRKEKNKEEVHQKKQSEKNKKSIKIHRKDTVSTNTPKHKILKDAETITADIENNIILEKTVEFAKNIAPIAIPFDEEAAMQSPMFYSVHADCRKSKKHVDTEKIAENRSQKKTCANNEDSSKKVHEIYRKNKMPESNSVKESLSSIQNNTLDDEPSQSTLGSYDTDRKMIRIECPKKKVRINKPKVLVSDSFDALATEVQNNAGNATIKLQLMNDRDKNLLTESIAGPIVHAIRECFTEVNNNYAIFEEIRNMQMLVKKHSQKLDIITNRLTCIEGKLNFWNDSNNKVQKVKPVKASTLEQLGEDLDDMPRTSDGRSNNGNNGERKNCGRVKLSPVQSADEEQSSMAGPIRGDGEILGYPSASQTQMNAERPNRIPARFCWTDTTMQNKG